MRLTDLPGELMMLAAVLVSLVLMIVAMLTYEIRRLRRQVKGLRFVQRVRRDSLSERRARGVGW